jgi:peroxiredoxin
MTPRKIAGIIGWGLFAIASVAIQYEVKVGMHNGSGETAQQLGSIKVGEPAPDFSLQDLAGHATALASYRGQKVVLLDFWATWCPPCRMSMPGLQKLEEEFKDRGLEILSVNQGEEADQVRHFIDRKKYSFHVVLDQDQAVAAKYGVKGIPTLVLVDKKGVVQRISVGYSGNENDLEQAVERLVKESAHL